MNETFGTRLRLQRERQQIDLTAISATTKISVALLDRLERDNVEQWPVGIFRRAYIRAYASAIGLEPEAVLREFLELYPEPTHLDPFSAAAAQAGEEGGGKQPGTRLGQIVRSAMAAMPGFLQRQTRPELSRMHLAAETADDREHGDDAARSEPVRAVVTRPTERGESASQRPTPASRDRSARRHEPFAPDPMPVRTGERAESASERLAPASRERSARRHEPPAPDPMPIGTGERAESASERLAPASRERSARRHEPPAPDPMPVSTEETPAPMPSEAAAPAAAAAPPPQYPAPRRELGLAAAAALCTRFAQVQEWGDVDVLLAEAAETLDAIGLLVWSHAGKPDALAAVLAHGYPPAVLARMPIVPQNADNAIAAAFRTGRRCVVAGQDGQAGALVVPLLAPTGCAGVLALELAYGGEQHESICAFAEIVAAQLAPLMGSTPAAEAVSA